MKALDQMQLWESKKGYHNRTIVCKHCDETFLEILKLEKHLRTHAETSKLKYDDCGKEFRTKWRLKKHNEMLTKQNVKKCH